MTHSLFRILNPLLFLISAAPICLAQAFQPAQVLAPSSQEAPDGPPLLLNFGASIAPSDGTLMIGMPLYQNNTGRVALFTRNSSGAWQRNGSLDAPAHGNLQFGWTIALQGDMALISAGFGIPDLYLYRRSNGVWTQAAVYKGLGAGPIMFAGDEVFIGRSVYHIDQQNRLNLVQRLTVYDTSTAGRVPAIAVYQGTAVLGFDEPDGTRGAAYVFLRSGERWTQHQKLTAIDGQPGDRFGSALSIEGNLLAVGAPGRTNQNPSCDTPPGGLAYVFKKQNGLWVEQQVIESPDECAFQFGSGVAINSAALAVGDGATPPANFANAYLYRQMGGQYVYENPVSALENGAPDLVATPGTLYVGFPVEGISGGVQFSPGEVQVFEFGTAVR